MSEEKSTVIQAARAEFLAALLKKDLNIDSQGVASIADRGSDISKSISKGLIARIGEATTAEKSSGQTAGKGFEKAVADFLRATFLALPHLRPGKWEVFHGVDRSKVRISNYQQYNHLVRLAEKAKLDPDLRAVLGGDYFIEPDVVVVRHSETDEIINQPGAIVDKHCSLHTPLRSSNASSFPGQFLHASISCKWTIRSDRAQNARTEALNLIRNRNGHVPHIVAITAEPLPKRIASIAQGSGDLDCVYHIALEELRAAVSECVGGRRSEQDQDLEMLIAAKRLRDISDLPFDLAI
ncbi:NgoMIV family type II restriction endonuclease [Prosthecobacter sp.]|uniref:NgoMIV family type II restriction endonuclease n=1 Tax=Prosthecobacter sp. TaxID=1965333 RepID=UPI00378429A0